MNSANRLQGRLAAVSTISSGRPMEAKNPLGIERILQYKFTNKNLLEEALRHSSFVNELGEAQLRDNERLEFLGDAVLNLIVGHILMHRYPELKEGDLSRSRANLVNESQLAKMARSFELGSYIQLGKGENQTHGRGKKFHFGGYFRSADGRHLPRWWI